MTWLRPHPSRSSRGPLQARARSARAASSVIAFTSPKTVIATGGAADDEKFQEKFILVLVAQSRRAEGHPGCPLLGVTRTSQALRANRVITTDDDSASITTTDTAAAKCPRVVNGSLTGSEHHRSRSEGTLRRHRSNHDASSPRRDRAPASSARPSPIPHRVRDRTTTPSSRRLREQIPKVWDMEAGDDRRQARERPARRAGRSEV